MNETKGPIHQTIFLLMPLVKSMKPCQPVHQLRFLTLHPTPTVSFYVSNINMFTICKQNFESSCSIALWTNSQAHSRAFEIQITYVQFELI